MSKTISRASIITIDFKNSSEDIKNGGYKYISYEIPVNPNETDDMIVFIERLFKKLNVSFEHIYESRYVFTKEDSVYDKGRIYSEIVKSFGDDNKQHKLVLK